MATPAKKTTPPKLEDLVKSKSDEEENKKVDSSSASSDSSQESNSSNSVNEEELNEANNEDNRDKEDKLFLSSQVTSTVPNKTPAELAAETPDETAARYDIQDRATDEDFDNPNVQVYRDDVVKQVPSGTHLHPDIAKDLQNRNISDNTTDSAQVTRRVTEYHAFAGDAPNNDKF